VYVFLKLIDDEKKKIITVWKRSMVFIIDKRRALIAVEKDTKISFKKVDAAI
jgi:hypothetical protein